ncbi:hypothetical protein A5724_26375 [Mycobacterium sp. ACS1612]|nr:hypothetical protein A5724_26375 [Mycobacterium sp. ACS1612]
MCDLVSQSARSRGFVYTYVGSPVELAAAVDVLIVAAAGGSGTTGLVSREVIDALGLDVFIDEPKLPEVLLTMDNVVVLPHVASGTVETRAAMEKLTLRNLDSFLRTGTLVTPAPIPAATSG